jgi:hypothetical protein
LDCKVCSSESQAFAKARILGKYDIQYFRCPSCGFVQTEKPYWLAESYSEAINRTDVGLVRRNIEQSRLLRVLIPLLADPDRRFVDYGGGYGMLVRLMRDGGFDFYWQDAHCENLFAQDFVAAAGANYELLTAFEVIEHLEDPRAGLEEMLGYADMVLLGTYLLPEPCPRPGDWWYYGLDHGQHIAFQSRTSLQALAAAAGAQLCSNGVNLHLVSRRPVSERRFRLATGKITAALLAPFLRRRTLLQDDFSHSIRQLSSKAGPP